MSTSALLLIALASVVLLLLLVIKAKAHPFVALLIVSLLVAFATGIPADKIITTIEKGMGGLLGHIASIIILGRHALSRTLGAGWTQNLDRLDNHHGGDGLSHHLAAVVCALMLTWVAPATLTSPRHRP